MNRKVPTLKKRSEVAHTLIELTVVLCIIKQSLLL